MSTLPPPAEPPRVACEVCLRQVPRSEAVVPEASDYVAYFCGLECFQKWKQQAEPAPDAAEDPATQG